MKTVWFVFILLSLFATFSPRRQEGHFYFLSNPSNLLAERVNLNSDHTIRRVIQEFVQGIEWDGSPRLLVFDMDGTLIADVGDRMEDELGQLIMEAHKKGIYIVILSGGSLGRIEKDVVFVFQEYGKGEGEGVFVFANAGAIGLTHQENWEPEEFYRITFREFKMDDTIIELMTAEELNWLIQRAQQIVGPGYELDAKESNISIYLGKVEAAVPFVPLIEDAIRELGINERLKQIPLLKEMEMPIEVVVRVSNSGYMDISLTPKNMALRFIVRKIEEITGKKVHAKHVVVMDDSPKKIGNVTLNAYDLFQETIGGEHPHGLNVGGLKDSDKVDSHVLTTADPGPMAVKAFMRLVVDAINAARNGQLEERLLVAL